MKKHSPVKLTDVERADLASIVNHPGMDVVIKKIIGGHCEQQLGQIMEVDLDDADRDVKLAAISSTAYAMKLFRDLVVKEIQLNTDTLLKREEDLKRQREQQEQTQ